METRLLGPGAVEAAADFEAVVGAGLVAVGGRGDDLLRGHTATEDTEPAARLAVVYQREFDPGFVGEFARDGRPGAAVSADYDYVNHIRSPAGPLK